MPLCNKCDKCTFTCDSSNKGVQIKYSWETDGDICTPCEITTCICSPRTKKTSREKVTFLCESCKKAGKKRFKFDTHGNMCTPCKVTTRICLPKNTYEKCASWTKDQWKEYLDDYREQYSHLGQKDVSKRTPLLVSVAEAMHTVKDAMTKDLDLVIQPSAVFTDTDKKLAEVKEQ